MSKNSFLTKLEKAVESMKSELQKNDGSALQTISSNIKSGYDNIKSGIQENEKTQQIIAEIKEHFDDLGEAILKGDRKLSSKAVTAIEKSIAKVKVKFDKHDEKKKKETSKKVSKATSPAKAKAKAAPKAKNSTKKTTKVVTKKPASNKSKEA